MLLGAADAALPVHDFFDDPASLTNYTIINESAGTLAVADGALKFSPELQASWWQGQTDAFFLFQEHTIIGDFVVETTVSALDADRLANGISTGFHMGGILVRDANDAAATNPTNNFVKLGNGFWNPVGIFQPTIQVGSTTDDVPSIANAPMDALPGVYTASLRLERSGSDFISSWMTGGSEWQIHSTSSRPDLDDALQIGLFAESFAISAGDRAQFEFENFQIATIPEPSAAIFGALGALLFISRRRR